MINEKRLLIQYQEFKTIWIFASNLKTEQEIITNSQVIYHSTKIIEVFNRIVENLGNRNSIEIKFLNNLGKNHYNYEVKPYYFNVKSTSMNF